MKRKIIIALMIALLIPSKVQASEMHRAIATAYCLQGKTATGTILDGTYKPVVASKREYLGKTMVVWRDNGDHLPHPENYMGIYEVQDTGSETIRSGRVIDIYLPTYEECMQFGAVDIIYQIIESEG